MRIRNVWLVILLAALPAVQRVRGAESKLFWGSDPIAPGETAMLFGDGIGQKVTAEGWRLADETVTAPPTQAEPAALPGAGKALEVLQASNECVKALLPNDWGTGIFAVRLKTESGISAPFFLNRPELWWWLGGENDQAYPGEDLRVFGKNFGEKTRVWLVGEGKPIALTMLKAEKYTVRCQLPKDIKPGAYALWLHNGFGGKSGFGKPLTIQVAQRTPWPTTRFDVRDFGAKADSKSGTISKSRQSSPSSKRFLKTSTP